MSVRRQSGVGWFTRWRGRRLKAAEVFVGSFLGLIVAGTLALRFLPGLYYGDRLNWTDAVFTATSAVCVTGLIVVDTATHFTFAGQVVLLVLIQLGGLGMLTLTSMIITALGGRISLRTESIAASGQANLTYVPPRKLIGDIVRFTFFFESLGAVFLYVVWGPRLGWGEAVWHSVFHAVSAFCNAGFSTFSDSLVGFQDSPATLLVVAVLVILGGFGFIAIEELALRARRVERRKISTHTKLVIVSTLALLGSGWILFACLEWEQSLAGLSTGNRLANAFFMSVTPRTAGFNAVDYTSITLAASFLTILLMMIGGSPGSTSGGLKTTTFALLGLLAWSRLRARASVSFLGRSIPEETVQRAVGLFVISSGAVLTGVFLLTSLGSFLDHRDAFLIQAFEVVSAFNTVGLSMGVTGDLSPTARWLVIVLMFTGRVGPLSITAVLRSQFAQRGRFRFAHEDVMVG
jgi:trk system potassium uptake protein